MSLNYSKEKLNMTMLCDFYELTMANGYFHSPMKDKITYFDMFFRKVPDDGGFAIMAGLEQLIDYVNNLHFSEEDIAYLRSRNLFSEDFLQYLENFKFTGDIWAVPEGTPIFPYEPVCVVRAPAIEAQLLETFFLLTFNHQSLIATKAKRICRAANGKAVLEFGSRRSHGPDAAILGARAAYIGGANATACAITDEVFGVPATGTMAHAWVQMFKDEYLLDFINVEELCERDKEDIDERVIEREIIHNIKKFILTFGRDFAFVGNQYKLEMHGVEHFPDLIFFNQELNALVIIELKKGAFKSLYLGQLCTYLRLVDDKIRKPHENPSIGIVLCKTADKKYVEYVIQDYDKPLGVATYKTSGEMPEKLKQALPDIEELKKLL